MSKNIKQVNPEENNQMEQNTEIMQETKNNFIAWVNTHKMKLIVAGVGITTIVGIILGLKNKDEFKALWTSLAENVKKVPGKEQISLPEVPVAVPVFETVPSTRTYTPPTEAVDVSQHIRTMSFNRHHSAEKAAEAATLGIQLLPNQTLVDNYTKYTA